METRSRGSAAIEKVIIHSPEGAATPRDLLNFLNGIDAGYHALSGDMELIVAASDDLIVQGAGMNTHSLHVCVVPGRAAWSRDEWLVHRAAIERAGRWTGEKCKRYSLPARLLTPAEVATSGSRGICRHWDVSLAGFTASEGHTDPGPNFPLDVFMAAATGIAAPADKEWIDVTVIPCPNRPTLSPNKQPHAEFLPPSKLFPVGAVALRHGAFIAHAVKHNASLAIWAPKPARGHKWVAMMEKTGRLDENPDPHVEEFDPRALRSKGVTLVDDHGDTTTPDQGLWA